MAWIRRALFAYFWACMLCLATVLGTRAIYYSFRDLPDWLARFTETVIQLQLRFFVLLVAIVPFEALVAVVLGFLFVFKRRAFLVALPDLSPGGAPRRALRSWVYAVVGTLCLLHSYLLDADPFTAPLCGLSLLLLAVACVGLGNRWGPVWRWAILVLIGLGLLLAWWRWAPSPACGAALALWTLCLLLVVWLDKRVLPTRDAMLVALVLLPMGTFTPILLAGALPEPVRSSATLMPDEGYAYGFCEFPESHQLFLTVPGCETGQVEKCLGAGYIAEYDTRDFSKRKVHRFFDANFYGTLRDLLCIDDVVEVTMNTVRLDNELRVANVMEFRADDPSRFRRTVFDDDLLKKYEMDVPGHRYAYDRKRNALFFSSEWTPTLFRLDRSTGVINQHAGDALPAKPFRLFVNFGLMTGPEAIHQGRDSLFLSEWADGARIWELDLGSLRVKSIRSTGDTGSYGVAVDEKYERLIASGLWGINVFDLNTGEVILRRRMGPGVRTALIDPHHDLIFLATTFGGYIWVLDRSTLDVLGRISTGLGGRSPYVSSDGRYFFASDQNHTFRITTEAIVKRFRRRG